MQIQTTKDSKKWFLSIFMLLFISVCSIQLLASCAWTMGKTDPSPNTQKIWIIDSNSWIDQPTPSATNDASESYSHNEFTRDILYVKAINFQLSTAVTDYFDKYLIRAATPICLEREVKEKLIPYCEEAREQAWRIEQCKSYLHPVPSAQLSTKFCSTGASYKTDANGFLYSIAFRVWVKEGANIPWSMWDKASVTEISDYIKIKHLDIPDDPKEWYNAIVF